MKNICKYIHYEIDLSNVKSVDKSIHEPIAQKRFAIDDKPSVILAPQWIQADVRSFDMKTLGKFR